MQPRRLKTSKDNLFDQGRQLLEDAENSTPALKKLKITAAERYFAVHLRGSARVSPRLGAFIGLFIFLVLTGISLVSDVKYHQFFGSILATCLLFALIILVFLLALCGAMEDSLVAGVITDMFDKVIATLKGDK